MSTGTTRVFVRYSNSNPTEAELRDIFSKHGKIDSLDMYAKFCFIEFDSPVNALNAVTAENGRKLRNINLEVEVSAVPGRKRKAAEPETNTTTSAAIGQSSAAIAQSSAAIGQSSAAIGQSSAAIGQFSAAIGQPSAAIGQTSTTISSSVNKSNVIPKLSENEAPSPKKYKEPVASSSTRDVDQSNVGKNTSHTDWHRPPIRDGNKPNKTVADSQGPTPIASHDPPQPTTSSSHWTTSTFHPVDVRLQVSPRISSTSSNSSRDAPYQGGSLPPDRVQHSRNETSARSRSPPRQESKEQSSFVKDGSVGEHRRYPSSNQSRDAPHQGGSLPPDRVQHSRNEAPARSRSPPRQESKEQSSFVNDGSVGEHRRYPSSNQSRDAPYQGGSLPPDRVQHSRNEAPARSRSPPRQESKEQSSFVKDGSVGEHRRYPSSNQSRDAPYQGGSLPPDRVQHSRNEAPARSRSPPRRDSKEQSAFIKDGSVGEHRRYPSSNQSRDAPYQGGSLPSDRVQHSRNEAPAISRSPPCRDSKEQSAFIKDGSVGEHRRYPSSMSPNVAACADSTHRDYRQSDRGSSATSKESISTSRMNLPLQSQTSIGKAPTSVKETAVPPAKPSSVPTNETTVNCEIIISDQKQKPYAVKVASRLYTLGLKVMICTLPSEDKVLDELEDAIIRGCLFAVVITEQHEKHNSLTVDILHGTPEEHRNMLFDDAIQLISNSYSEYKSTKVTQPPVPPAAAPESKEKPKDLTENFVRPDTHTRYLINLLAADSYLSLEELTRISEYLNKRMAELIKPDILKPSSTGQASATKKQEEPVTKKEEPNLKKQDDPNSKKQEELKAKILKILHGGTADGRQPSFRAAQPDIVRPSAEIHKQVDSYDRLVRPPDVTMSNIRKEDAANAGKNSVGLPNNWNNNSASTDTRTVSADTRRDYAGFNYSRLGPSDNQTRSFPRSEMSDSRSILDNYTGLSDSRYGPPGNRTSVWSGRDPTVGDREWNEVASAPQDSRLFIRSRNDYDYRQSADYTNSGNTDYNASTGHSEQTGYPRSNNVPF